MTCAESCGPVEQRGQSTHPGPEATRFGAGLRVADGDETATIGLRSPNVRPAHATLDVCADADRVTITLAAVPDPETWSKLLALLKELLDHGF